MSIKQSRDELNPPIVTVGAVPQTSRSARSAKDYLALAIATCGVGYLPLAPGTWGSLLAVGIYSTTQLVLLGHPINTPGKIDPAEFFVGQVLAIIVIALLGIWAASRTEQVFNTKDPGRVVIDEVAGQLIALLPLPFSRGGYAPLVVLIAFLLFRFFDIVKPYPARKVESLKGGLGIMADDLVAGAYAAIIVAIIVKLGWFA